MFALVKSGHLAAQSACLLYTRKRTSSAEFEMATKGQYWTFERTFYSLGRLGDPRVDFTTKQAEIDRFCKKRVGAPFQSLAPSLGIPVGGDHYHRDVRSNRFGFRQQLKAGHPRHVDI